MYMRLLVATFPKSGRKSASIDLSFSNDIVMSFIETMKYIDEAQFHTEVY